MNKENNINGSDSVGLRSDLLTLAKGICEQNAHMHYKLTQHWNPVTAEDIMVEAEKLYQFAQEKV